MTILGINLSSTFQKKKKSKKGDDDNEKSKLLSNQTMLAVVIGKMLVMPIIGIASTWILQRYYIDLPDGELDFHVSSFVDPAQLHERPMRVC